jgi:Resolvase, N terminal domain
MGLSYCAAEGRVGHGPARLHGVVRGRRGPAGRRAGASSAGDAGVHEFVEYYFPRYNRAMSTSRPRAYSYIRMSTPEQLKGHSKKRQLEKSIKYAERHNLEFADESQIEDIGVSAFRGDNIKYGALGQFIDAVEKGRVPAGSYLLVESLDRISRQEIVPSLRLFLQIIEAGIILVTLEDEKVFKPR